MSSNVCIDTVRRGFICILGIVDLKYKESLTVILICSYFSLSEI